jgi:hypothetical protein
MTYYRLLRPSRGLFDVKAFRYLITGDDPNPIAKRAFVRFANVNSIMQIQRLLKL